MESKITLLFISGGYTSCCFFPLDLFRLVFFLVFVMFFFFGTILFAKKSDVGLDKQCNVSLIVLLQAGLRR